MARKVDRVLERLIASLLPPRCLLCAGHAGPGLDLCSACEHAIPQNRPACSLCASPTGKDGICGRCARRPPAFDRALAASVYEQRARVLVPGLKYAGRLAVARCLAELMIRRLDLADVDALVPVPLHPARIRQRGYNQALEIARVLAAHSGLNLRPELIERGLDTPAQTGLSRKQRVRNLRAAFHCPLPLPPRIALVDDVMTTGATLDACASTLKRAGAEHVVVWVFARAPPPR